MVGGRKGRFVWNVRTKELWLDQTSTWTSTRSEEAQGPSSRAKNEPSTKSAYRGKIAEVQSCTKQQDNMLCYT